MTVVGERVQFAVGVKSSHLIDPMNRQRVGQTGHASGEGVHGPARFAHAANTIAGSADQPGEGGLRDDQFRSEFVPGGHPPAAKNVMMKSTANRLEPVMATLPESDARDFLERAGTGVFSPPGDVDGLLAALKGQHAKWKSGKLSCDWNGEFVRQFERKNLTAKLAEFLDQVR